MKKIRLTESDFTKIVSGIVKEIINEGYRETDNVIDGKYVVYYGEVDGLIDVIVNSRKNLVIVDDTQISGQKALQAIDWIKQQKKYSKCSTEEAIESWLYEIRR